VGTRHMSALGARPKHSRRQSPPPQTTPSGQHVGSHRDCTTPLTLRMEQQTMHSGARNPTGEPQDSQASSFQTSLDRKAHLRLARSNMTQDRLVLRRYTLCFPKVTFHSFRSHWQCCPRHYPASHWPDCTLSHLILRET
jgi:hypothetical protein